MIVCVLLVSNSQGCCLAPRRDNTRGSLTPRSPSDRPTVRQHPREFDTNNTHTIMFDPDYNMMPPFFPQQPIFCSLKQFKVWIESNRSLRWHVTTLSWWQVSQSPPPPVAKMRVPVSRETGRVKSNCARPTSFASRGDNEVDHAVCLKAEFQMTLSFPMKMASSTQLWYIRASAGRYVFRWNRLLDEGLAFVQAGVPSCPDDVTRISNVTSQM